MKLRSVLIVAWMLHFLQSFQFDESISFSLPLNSSLTHTLSFWYGTINSTLFENDLQIQLYLNKPQGLIFYAIDNLYKAIWVEIEESNIKISYYMFKFEEVYSHSFGLKTLCNIQYEEDVVLDLKFSLNKDELNIICNGNKKTYYFYSYNKLLNNFLLVKFLNEMKKPVPILNSFKENVTHIWIGNTPTITTDLFYKNKLISQKYNFRGCIKLLKDGISQVKLATTGLHYGNMIEPLCKPACVTNSCYNNAKCTEGWRLRFSCNCGISFFAGHHCNESYGLQFNGQESIDIAIDYNLKMLQVSFNSIFSPHRFQGVKLFSIEFEFNNSLIVYIDSRRYIQAMLINEKSERKDTSFKHEIESNKTYLLSIYVNGQGITFKLMDLHYFKEERTIYGNYTNKRMKKILVADSHSQDMTWMSKFKGCISNLIIKSARRKFYWNIIPQFSNFTKCKKNNLHTSQYKTKTSNDKMKQYSNNSSLQEKIKSEVAQGSAIYVTILVIPLVAIIIVVVLILKFKNKQRLKNKNNDFINQKLIRTYKSDNKLDRKNSTQNAAVQYKPAYKAGGSQTGKSILSLPSSIQDEDLQS